MNEAGVDPFLGEVFADRYEVVERIGEGGMGVVYRARQLAMDRMVALKVLRASARTKESSIKRFLREMRTTSRINHPNVVSVYDFGETDEGDFFLAMELLHGDTLKQRLEGTNALPIADACTLGVQILEALDAAHSEGIVHRDLKPENIMITEKYGKQKVKVLDFGIARFVEDGDDIEGARVTRSGMFVGTPHFASPEQAMGEELDQRSDLYAFGVLLYRMVTGRLPFDHPGKPMRVLRMQMTEKPPTPSDISSQPIPPWLDQLLLDLLEKYPEDRPSQAGAIIARIHEGNSTPETMELDTRKATPAPAAQRDGTLTPDDVPNRTGREVFIAALVAALATAAAFWAFTQFS